MTVDEVKRSHDLREVARSNGIRIYPSGMARCPFHKDGSPSLKLYQDHFHCYGCHVHGDVIDFVAMLQGTDFKTAFLELGGTYSEDPEETREAVKRSERQRRLRELGSLGEKIGWHRWRAACAEVDRLQALPEAEVPFSETWCQLQEAIMQRERIADELNG